MGLLLLRSSIGIVLLIQGVTYLAKWQEDSTAWWRCLLALACGTLLVIGYLTPAAGAVAALSGLALFWRQPHSENIIGNDSSSALLAVIAIAVVCLGPGAFSLDARFFGRREIIVPPASHPPDS